MNYTDILNLKDKESIDSISGKVVGIYQNQPTPRQKAAGIVPQDVVLQDDNGDKIRLRINTEGMHLPQEARGRHFKFDSSPNDSGKPSGLTKNVFNNNHTVNVFQDAIITGDKAMQNEKSKPNSNKSMSGYRPAEQSLQQSCRVDIDDHVHALCDMVRKVDAELGESDVAKHEEYPDFLVRLATTVYIQSCKENLIPKRELYKPAVSVLSTGETLDTPKKASAQGVVDRALSGSLTADEIKHLDSQAIYDWEEIYDGVEDALVKRGHDRDDISSAFDDLKAHFIKRTKNFNSVEFCKVVLTDIGSFIEAVEAAQERDVEQGPGLAETVRGDDGSIPF